MSIFSKGCQECDQDNLSPILLLICAIHERCTRKMFDFYHEKCDIFITMLRSHVLIVDDDKAFARKLAGALQGLFRIETCHSEADFRKKFAVNRYDLLIMDMRLEKDREGLDLLKEVLDQDPMQAAIVMTAYADMETYTDAIQSGALNYFDKHEFSPALIARTIEAILQQGRLQRRLAVVEQRLETSEPLEIIGASAEIKQIGELLRRAAENGDMPVFITGEPGSGKELVARNIHRLSRRRADGAFVYAACGRMSPNEVQSTLFGSVQGVEPRRPRESRGWTDDARGGVLFVDGITKFNGSARSALLDFIESHSFLRVGGKQRIEVDAQVVIAVSDTAERDSVVGEIREVLVGRLGGMEIHVPALRDRVEDIPLIAQYALQNLYRHGRTQARSFRGAAIGVLESLPWPGNVMELKSAIEYAATRADVAEVREIGPEHLPFSVSESPFRSPEAPGALDYQLHLARSELALVESAIERFETTKKSEIAGHLGYHDRFKFTRRIRRNLETYPTLQREFPKTAGLFPARSDKK